MTRLDWVAAVGAVIAVISCGGNTVRHNSATVANKQGAAKTEATNPAPTAKQIAKAAADARHAISETRKLNYGAPRRNLRIEQQTAAMSLSLKACRLGDTAWCWRGTNINRLGIYRVPQQLRLRIALTIETRSNRLAGDDLSCRALTSFAGSTGDAKIDRADCERGVATACYEVALIPENAGATDAKVRLLQRGCSLGFSESCRKLEVVLMDQAGTTEEESDRITALQNKLENAECARGWPESCWGLDARSNEQIILVAEKGCLEEMPGDCMTLRAVGGPREELISWAWTCPLRGFGCQHLAKLQSDPIDVRDALEQGCQYRNDDLCLDLVKRYRAGKLPEPVPGRAADLASYLCTTKFAAEVCPGTSKQ